MKALFTLWGAFSGLYLMQSWGGWPEFVSGETLLHIVFTLSLALLALILCAVDISRGVTCKTWAGTRSAWLFSAGAGILLTLAGCGGYLAFRWILSPPSHPQLLLYP